MNLKYKGFIFDLDGTVYRGNSVIQNADITINKLQSDGKKIVFISNKTTGTAVDYFNFLINRNLKISLEQIITATTITKKYLKENFASSTFYAIGEQIFINEISECGLQYSEDYIKTEIVLITLDRTLNYNKLEIAAKSIENGARFFAANIDDTCPVDSGEILDAGSTISALEKRTHKKLEMNFGKPSELMMNEVLSLLNIDKKDLLLVGDRLETDIAMGNKFGIDTAIVSTGVRNFPNGNDYIVPTYKLNSIYDLIK